MTDFDSIYNKYGAFLKLISIKHNEMHLVNEVQISYTAKQIAFVFSEDFEKLCISFVEDDKTFIHVISRDDQDIKQMIEDYKNKVFYYSHQHDSNFITKLTFDTNLKFLAGYGDTKVLIMDMRSENEPG